jgi:hypothetical protein
MALALSSVSTVAFQAPLLSGGSRSAVRMQEVAEAPPPFNPVTFAKSLPGITGPLDFFDPAGFCNDASEGKIRFYREVELKHGRVAMLAAFGFLVAEQFHPLFGGEIDVPSYVAFQEVTVAGCEPIMLELLCFGCSFAKPCVLELSCGHCSSSCFSCFGRLRCRRFGRR